MSTLDNVTVLPKANVYFDGKCVSHTLELPDGTRKSVGVILPSMVTFRTGVPELMETVAGECRVRIEGESEWRTYGAGESFRVPADTRFDIEVAGAPYHYVCHFLPAE